MYQILATYVKATNEKDTDGNKIFSSRKKFNEWLQYVTDMREIYENSIIANEYQDGYCKELDRTIVTKLTMHDYDGNEEIIGWYHGEPDDMETMRIVMGAVVKTKAYYDFGYKGECK